MVKNMDDTEGRPPAGSGSDQKQEPFENLENVAEMNQSMKAMTLNTGIMSHDMGIMNQLAPW